MMKLYSGPMSMFGAKAQIAALEKSAAFELIMVPHGLRNGYHPKHPEVLRINPKGQVPLLVDGEVEIFDSTQIFEFLEDRYPDPPLWPRDVAARAVARQLEHCSDEVFFPHVIALMGGRAALDDDKTRAARASAATYYRLMDQRLAGRDYLAGAFGYSDIAFYMAQLFGAFLSAPMTDETPTLQAWRSRMTARPAVLKVALPMAAYIAGKGLQPPDFLKPLLASTAQTPRS
jgi:glutathione S-transferase